MGDGLPVAEAPPPQQGPRHQGQQEQRGRDQSRSQEPAHVGQSLAFKGILSQIQSEISNCNGLMDIGS